MAFGLSPKYSETFLIEDLSIEQFLVLALESAKKQDWNIGHTSATGFVAYSKFSMSSWSEEIKVKSNGNVAEIKSECTGNQLADWGKNKSNVQNFISTLNELKVKFTAEELDQKYDELKAGLMLSEGDSFNEPPAASKEKLTGFLSVFKPVQGYFITPIIINLNIIIFILMILSGVDVFLPDSASLISWGANFRPITLAGEWWRLITSCFLHIGVLHLLMNMYALLYIGLLLEPYLGRSRFLGAYILSGLFASLASVWWNDFTISAGASGAIFGMYGVFLAMLTTNLIEKSARKALLTSIGVFVAYNLLNGLKGGIDNAAHLGGLISGLLIGYAYFPSLRNTKKPELKFITIAVLSVIVISSSFFVIRQIPNDIGEYDKGIQDFLAIESKAIEIYNLPPSTSNDQVLLKIKDGLQYWNDNISLVNKLDQLTLPEHIHARNKKLLQYCDLRVKSYEFIYKSIAEDTDQYQLQLDDYNKQIEGIIKELSTQ